MFSMAAVLMGMLATSYGSEINRSFESEAKVVNLRTEYKIDPIGIDADRPRFSWQLRSSARNVHQVAYQIRVGTNDVRDGVRFFFDSGKVLSEQSVLLRYAGPPMESRQRYYWQVRVWDSYNRQTPWSAPAFWEMGLLSKADWRASWISPNIGEQFANNSGLPLLRTEFQLKGEIAHARAYVTSRGLYELRINGTRVGDQLFTPGWTSFENRLQYQTYDVTSLLKKGQNAVGAMLGGAWYGSKMLGGLSKNRSIALLAQIEVAYTDGRKQMILTGPKWKGATGPVRQSDLYDGETYDARLERQGWDSAGYDDRDWSNVAAITPPRVALIAPVGPPVKRMDERIPERIFKSPNGTIVVDMGQNLVGWVRLRVNGPAGTVIVLRHAEALDREGNLYTENLRTAQQRIQYTLKGIAEETFEPRFTFQGFRYVSVDGFPGELQPSHITGMVIHSEMAQTGIVETSNALVNKLFQNIAWTQKGNFLDVPTDCPQRDERLGWSADAQLFSTTAALNMDVASFFTKWLGDVATEQTAEGAVPWEVPRMIRRLPLNALKKGDDRVLDAAGASVYGDAITIVPWNMYLAYGDVDILRTRYVNMERWVRYIQSRSADGIWRGDFTFGDWLDVASLSNDIDINSNFGVTSEDLISTAYYARSVDIVRQAARVLGKTDDERHYRNLFGYVRKAFQRAFVSNDGNVGNGTQTAYVLALDFELLPEELQAVVARRLADDVRTRGHLTTGIVGTSRILSVLSRFGYTNEAYGLLIREEFPSWLYPVTRGATTIWERWDGIRPDGSFADWRGNSLNHYVFGSVGEWMYRVMGGINIDPDEPGYKHTIIRPLPGGGFKHVHAAIETGYGRLSSRWSIEEGKFILRVEVPPNSYATVHMPCAPVDEADNGDSPSEHRFRLERHRADIDNTGIEVGSGEYNFSCSLRFLTTQFHWTFAPRHTASSSVVLLQLFMRDTSEASRRSHSFSSSAAIVSQRSRPAARGTSQTIGDGTLAAAYRAGQLPAAADAAHQMKS